MALGTEYIERIILNLKREQVQGPEMGLIDLHQRKGENRIIDSITQNILMECPIHTHTHIYIQYI